MSDAKHTPGPWQVIETRYPHHLGGEHIERRIFTTWDHPQLKAPDGVVNSSVGIGAKKGGKPVHLVSIDEADARLIAAAPELLEALIELRKQINDFCVQYGEADFYTGDATKAIAKATGAA